MRRYRQQGGEQEQIMQAIAQALQAGKQPQEIMQMLVQMGLDEQQASQMIQMVMEQMQGAGQQQMSPEQMSPDMMPPQAEAPMMAAQGAPEGMSEDMMPPIPQEGMPPMRYGGYISKMKKGGCTPKSLPRKYNSGGMYDYYAQQGQEAGTPFQQYLQKYPNAPAGDTLVGSRGWFDPREFDYGTFTPQYDDLREAYDKTYGEYDYYNDLTPENEALRRQKRGGMIYAQAGQQVGQMAAPAEPWYKSVIDMFAPSMENALVPLHNPAAMRRLSQYAKASEQSPQGSINRAGVAASKQVQDQQQRAYGGGYKEVYLTGGQAAALAKMGYVVEEM